MGVSLGHVYCKVTILQEPAGGPEGTEEATAGRQEVYDPVN